MSCIFFFKQKTAYEMRISDWSSDVCSSDLLRLRQRLGELIEKMMIEHEIAHAPADEAGAIGELRQLLATGLDQRPGRIIGGERDILQLGRASCRERVCQYV